MANLTNGTLDTRLKQELTQKFEIPCNIEYDRFSSFKIAGGNGIWLVHCPSGVKAYYATENNYDKKIPLNQENRGMKYAEIGNEGITKLYDNFYIFTEGTSADDKLEIMVSSQESAVEPILGNASGNIAQLDEVGGFSQSAINQMTRAIYGGVSSNYSKLYLQIDCGGSWTCPSNLNLQGKTLYHFPLGKDFKISSLNLKNNALYCIREIGHFDLGQKNMGGDSTQGYRATKGKELNIYMKGSKTVWPNGKRIYMVNTSSQITYDLENLKVSYSGQGQVYDPWNKSTSRVSSFEGEADIEIETTTYDSQNEILDTTASSPLSLYIDRYDTFWSGGISCNYKHTPIWDVKPIELSINDENYYDIWISGHLSLINFINNPQLKLYTDINSSFANLYDSNFEIYYKKFDLWGLKTRHSNNNNKIINYEGTGNNIGTNCLVARGEILNKYDNICLGWNITNLYNPDLKLTASAANCHSSIILEITEL